MSFHFSPKIVTDGLILYLDAANTKSFVSGSASWNDLSSDNTSGNITLFGGVGFTSSNAGSLVFDGANTYAKTNNQFVIPEKITFSCWVKIGTQSYVQTLIGDGGQSLTLGYIWIFRGSSSSTNLVFQYSNGTDIQTISTSGYFTNFNNMWVNVAITIDYVNGGNVIVYRNGVLVNNQVLTTPQVPRNLNRYFGAYSNSNSVINGNLSNVLMYNRILSSTEIVQNYKAIKSRFGL